MSDPIWKKERREVEKYEQVLRNLCTTSKGLMYVQWESPEEKREK